MNRLLLKRTDVSFNSCDTQTGTVGYIDNWELYSSDLSTGLNNSIIQKCNVHTKENSVVLTFALEKASAVEYHSQSWSLYLKK